MRWIEEHGPDDGIRWESKKLDTSFSLHESAVSDADEFILREIPQDRFVEYEPKDLAWMVPLGMAPIREDVLECQKKAVENILKQRLRDVMLRNMNRYFKWFYEPQAKPPELVFRPVLADDRTEVGNSISNLWIPGQE